MQRWPRRPQWPALRAGLIAAAIGFGLVDGCPLPTPDRVPDWERGFVEPVRTVQHVVEAPVAWMTRVFRVSQQWSLYQAPTAQRYRLWIEGQLADRTWRITYRAGDAEHAEDAALIEHARVWGTWDPTDVPAHEYPAFARWYLARLLAVHPDFVAVRMRMEQLAIGQGEVTPLNTFGLDYTQVRSVR